MEEKRPQNCEHSKRKNSISILASEGKEEINKRRNKSDRGARTKEQKKSKYLLSLVRFQERKKKNHRQE